MNKPKIEGTENFESQLPKKNDTASKMGYDGRPSNASTESMVNWIGKDSKSESIEYLEECNTHQCGE